MSLCVVIGEGRIRNRSKLFGVLVVWEEKYLGTLEAWRNDAPYSHIYGPHHEFNERILL